MANDGPEHKLVAILAVDIVGYSGLTEIDQSGTHGQLLAHRKEVIDPAIAKYGGRIFTTAGDGFLFEFASPLNAVRCAVAIQGDMERRNINVPADSRIVFRVGVNLGDVTVEKDGLYGGGVNIAARLESICKPGGVLISGKVYDEVHDQLDLAFDDRGPQTVKNIANPVQAYAVNLGEAAIAGAAPAARRGAQPGRITPGLAIAAAVIFALVGALAWQATLSPTVEAAVVADMAFPLPDKPSIAVLAFENLSPEADDELLADSFSEDILTSLSKLSGLFVISRTTSFTYKGKDAPAKQIAEDLGIRYVLEGSVQRDGDRIRATAQLIDAIGGQHVWADRYDRDLDDLFAVKDDITLNIVSNISAELVLGDRDRVLGRETGSLEAWLFFQQSLSAFTTGGPAGFNLAVDLAERALAIDPGFVSALAILGHLYLHVDRLEQALEYSDRALGLDPDHAYDNAARSDYYLQTGQIELPLEFAQKAVDSDPNDFASHYFFGSALVLVGRPIDAVREFRLAARLSPVTPYFVLRSLGAEEAVAVAEQILDHAAVRTDHDWLGHAIKATALYRLGRGDEAQAQMALALELEAETIEFMHHEFRDYKDQVYTEGLLETWRRLGMPEE